MPGLSCDPQLTVAAWRPVLAELVSSLCSCGRCVEVLSLDQAAQRLHSNIAVPAKDGT